MLRIFPMVLALTFIYSAAFAGDQVSANLPAWKFENAMSLPEVPEPSGLCFYPPDNSMFIVDDGAQDRNPAVYEIDTEGNVLQKLEIGADLEGICYCPVDGLIYVADEHEERIYSIDPQSMQLVESYRIDRFIEQEEILTAGGNGIEGIEYIADGFGDWSDCFVLLNQDDPHALIALRRADLIPETEGLCSAFDYRLIAEINAGSLHFDAGSGMLWVVHSWMNVMELWDIRKLQLDSWKVVPGAAQEAVCVDAEGRLWIGSDSGGIASYTAIE